jgi:hypothetical protein
VVIISFNADVAGFAMIDVFRFEHFAEFAISISKMEYFIFGSSFSDSLYIPGLANDVYKKLKRGRKMIRRPMTRPTTPKSIDFCKRYAP